MTDAQRRYLRTEALIGATISAILSLVFILLIFGTPDRIAVHALIGDAVPQGFFIAMMATLVPTLLTRRRLRAGKVAPIVAPPSRWPAHLGLRAMLAAGLAALAGVVLTALLAVAGIGGLPLAVVLVGKAVWGFLLGGGVATAMTRIALAKG